MGSPARVLGTDLNQFPTNDERPRRRGLVGERVAKGRYDAFPTPNLPRSVFLNRASFPLELISLRMAA